MMVIPYMFALTKDELIQLTALRWIDDFFTICPDDLLPFTPRLVEKVLPSLAHETTSVDQAAHRVNENLSNLILSVPQASIPAPPPRAVGATPRIGSISGASVGSGDDKDSQATSRDTQGRETPIDPFDYYATVTSLTLQFLNDHEETRVAALDWLIMLHKKAPNRVPIYLNFVDSRF
jgi:vacuole morphology and inheritance protein 14